MIKQKRHFYINNRDKLKYNRKKRTQYVLDTTILLMASTYKQFMFLVSQFSLLKAPNWPNYI
jgi:hypothetical protein